MRELRGGKLGLNIAATAERVVMSVAAASKHGRLSEVLLSQGPCSLFPACFAVHWVHIAWARVDAEVRMNAWGNRNFGISY